MKNLFYLSVASMPDLEFNLELLDLYTKFIARKYDFYHIEKFQVPVKCARLQ